MLNTTIITSPENKVRSQNKPISIILLHGLGADGNDFADLAEMLAVNSMTPLKFVLPDAPLRPVTFANYMQMRAWFDIHKLAKDGVTDIAGIIESKKAVEELITREIENGFSSDRIILAGFSQGAAMALLTGLSYKQSLAGILVLSGFLPTEPKLPNVAAGKNHNTPVLFVHGTFDNIVPLGWARDAFELLKSEGYKVSLETYPMAHSLCPQAVDKIQTWFSEIV